MAIETMKKMTVEEILAYVKSFDHYVISDGGTEWNCQLCGRWKGQKGHGVEHAIFLYPSEDPDDFQGDIVPLGSDCLKKIKKALAKEK